MKDCFCRLDERLIHGQTAVAWHRRIQADIIVVVSEQAAKDDMKKTLLQIATPAGTQLKIFFAKDALEYFKKRDKLENKHMIIFDKLEDILYLCKNGINISFVNIGGMYFKTERKKYRKSLFLNTDEKDMLKEISAFGVKLEYQMSPGNKKEDILEIIK